MIDQQQQRPARQPLAGDDTQVARVRIPADSGQSSGPPPALASRREQGTIPVDSLARQAAMPTPVQHLVIADAILANKNLPDRTRGFLSARRAEFLFGNVAPDVQTVSGQPRAATHFFSVPLDSGRPAHQVMF